MRISDWSSDVCSSDLHDARAMEEKHHRCVETPVIVHEPSEPPPLVLARDAERRVQCLADPETAVGPGFGQFAGVDVIFGLLPLAAHRDALGDGILHRLPRLDWKSTRLNSSH